ncbi:hypothetical protein HQ447_07325 [bacterium]|nr:hypothetical protein [bacterium]
MEATKQPPYQLFRIGRGGQKFNVLQVRAVKDGKPLDASELTAYVVLLPIETPWWEIRIGKSSRMMLADDAARPLLADGVIEPILSETLIPWRHAYEADQTAKYFRRKDRQSEKKVS